MFGLRGSVLCLHNVIVGKLSFHINNFLKIDEKKLE